MATSADRMTAILPPTEDATVIYKALKDVKKMLMDNGQDLTPQEVLKMIYKLAEDVHDLSIKKCKSIGMGQKRNGEHN